MKRQIVGVASALALLFYFTGKTLAADTTVTPEAQRPPLELRLIVDPEFMDSLIYKPKEPDKFFDQLFSEASAVFRSEIGRELKIVSVEYSLFIPPPPKVNYPNLNDAKILDTQHLIAWLEKMRDERAGPIIVFVTHRSLISPLSFKAWSGYGNRGFLFFRYYSLDIPYTMESFLHELGHTCGADHSLQRDSLMNSYAFGVRAYGDKQAMIKKNCG